MDSVEMHHFRQRSFLPSQPVRRTPILHNFLHILSSRSPVGQGAGEHHQQQQQQQQQSRPLGEGESPSVPLAQYLGSERGPAPFPGCTQHLGMVCLCSRCSGGRSQVTGAGPADGQRPPTASTFSSARTEPRQPPERPSAFTSVYYGGESHSSPRLPPDWSRSLQGVREGVGGAVGTGLLLPPRTSSSSVSLLSVLRQQDASSQSPVYTSATEGRGFPLPPQPGDPGAAGAAGGSSGTTSSGHHPFWDGARGGGGNTASFRNVLQCNLSRYFLEFDRLQDLEAPLHGHELLNNNLDPERPGPSSSSSSSAPSSSGPAIIHYQPPLPPLPPPPAPHNAEGGAPPLPPSPRGHLNRCRACHNLLTFNHDSQRWERTSQASSTSASPLEPSPSSSSLSAAAPPPAPPPSSLPAPPSSSAPWQLEDSRRMQDTQPQDRRVPLEPSQPPPPASPPVGGGGAGTVAFPMAATPPVPPGEQTVGLVYNQDTAQWERVYRQTTTGRSADTQEALSQEMPVEPPDEDSLRR